MQTHGTSDSPTRAAYERPTPIAAAVARVLELPDFQQRLHLCLSNVYGDEKDPAYWLSRSEELQAAVPRPEEFRGLATNEELSEAWHRFLSAASACRAHAQLLTEEA